MARQFHIKTGVKNMKKKFAFVAVMMPVLMTEECVIDCSSGIR